MLELEERVDNLETIFGRFIINNDKTLRRLENMMLEMRQQADQDRERTDQILTEMRQQAEQDRERTDQILTEMRQQAEQDRQQAAQDRERTDQRFAQMQQQAEQDRRELNKKWGELANRLGTVAEDIVAPNLPRLAREYFGCPERYHDFMVRRYVRHQVDLSKEREFDVILVYPKTVLINETKSTARIDYINDFIDVMADIHGYFPEYQGKRVIPLFASFSIPEHLLRYLTKQQIYAVGMGEETMKLLNFDSLAQANLT